MEGITKQETSKTSLIWRSCSWTITPRPIRCRYLSHAVFWIDHGWSKLRSLVSRRTNLKYFNFFQLAADGVGLSFVHFHQQAVSPGLRDLCHRQTRRAELHPAGTPTRLSPVESVWPAALTQSPPFSISHQGERTERGSQRVWFEPQLTACHRRLDFVSRSLPHTHTHAKSEQFRSETHLLAKYSQRENKVHWSPSDWSEGGATQSSDREFCLFKYGHHDMTVTYISFGQTSSLFVLEGVSMCVCVWRKQPDIYFSREREWSCFFASNCSRKRGDVGCSVPQMRRGQWWCFVQWPGNLLICHLQQEDRLMPKHCWKQEAKSMRHVQGCI